MVCSGKNGGLHLKQISYYKQTGGYHPTTLASERSGIRRAAKKFIFKDNKLFYVGKDKRQMRRVIVSDEEKRKVLERCHENPTGVHHGISRTLTLVESQYYWTSVTSDIKQWEYACQHCKVAKNVTVEAPKFHTIKAEEPWTVVTIELVGPFNATNKNHLYVILLTDVFTKWVVVMPLHDLSAAEVAKAIVNASFSYGPPQKIAIDQGEEFVHQETNQNTPYFQMFNRKPYMPSTLSVVQGESDCMFTRILTAIKQTETRMQERTASSCQNMKKMPVDQQSANKVHLKKKQKLVNPFLLQAGHEVLTQKKNWWKDGRFQSEWVGPCIIDYITDDGCAILRDAAGPRLKRPIKISHLKPYTRGSNKPDGSYVWQNLIMIDHDYVGSPETSTKKSPQDVFSEKGVLPPDPDNALLDKDHVPERRSGAQPECTDPDTPTSATTNPKKWPAAFWTLQSKMEVT